MPDYENDLAFKPAMTWEELCKCVHETLKQGKDGFALRHYSPEYFWIDDICFTKWGDVSATHNGNDVETINSDRTYEQMKNIIDNLYGE